MFDRETDQNIMFGDQVIDENGTVIEQQYREAPVTGEPRIRINKIGPANAKDETRPMIEFQFMSIGFSRIRSTIPVTVWNCSAILTAN
jgi:hypothetical protein